MSYTLISIVGTGMYKTRDNYEGYEETEYIFDDNKKFKTRLFLQSILECEYREIDQIILVGTKTSSWDALVDKDKDNRNETIELWMRLFDECEQVEKGKKIIGISDENICDLEKYLTERFSIPTKIKVHTQNINDESVIDLFECYTDINNILKKDNDVLFDITHGFRSMPVLLYQSLQYSISKDNNKKVELVYGELDLLDRKKGYVRNLSKYWDLSELSDAIQLFESKLDGFRLAELIKKDWEKGSKAIKSLSDIAQTNFALQFTDVSKQIKNALKFYPESAPSWLSKIKKSLESMDKLVIDNNVPRTLLNYAKYLYDRNLNTQAIITLQITVESSVAIKNGRNVDELGDYDWWQNYGKNYLRNSKNQNWKDLKDLQTLEKIRNQIAHGGGKDKLNGKPSASNLPNIFKKSFSCVEKLLEILEF